MKFKFKFWRIGRKAKRVPMIPVTEIEPNLGRLGGANETAEEILSGLNGVIDEMLPGASAELVQEARLEILWAMAVANGKRSGARPGARFVELCNKEGFKPDVTG